MKRLLTTRMSLSGMTIVLAIALLSMGTFALFSDYEGSTGNTFGAGTLDLQVDGVAGGTMPFNYTNLAPGFERHHEVYLSNTGSLNGHLYVTIKNVVNDDNGCNEPEAAVDATCGGDPEGDLGNALITMEGPNGHIYIDTVNNLSGVALDFGEMSAGSSLTQYLCFKIDSSSGNEIQSDSVVFDVEWSLVQE